MRLIAFLLCFTAALATAAQSQFPFSQISLKFSHSRRIPDNSMELDLRPQFQHHSVSVHLVIKPMQQQGLKHRYENVDTSFTIGTATYDSLWKAAIALKPEDMLGETQLLTAGMDGTRFTITLEGELLNKVQFSAWSPDYETDRRNLRSFLTLCTRLLNAAHVDPKRFLP